jgi:hypothetical protein
MRKRGPAATRVVSRLTLRGGLPGPCAACSQTEWEERESRRPGHHTLILAGVASEAAAERLARESPGRAVTPRKPLPAAPKALGLPRPRPTALARSSGLLLGPRFPAVGAASPHGVQEGLHPPPPGGMLEGGPCSSRARAVRG